MNEIFKPLTQNEKDEIARKEGARTISDASLIEGGAKWTVDDHGEKVGMDITGMQEWLAQKQMEISKMGKDKWLEIVEGMVKREKIKERDKIQILNDKGKLIDAIYIDIDIDHDSLIYDSTNDELSRESIEIDNIMDLHKI